MSLLPPRGTLVRLCACAGLGLAFGGCASGTHAASPDDDVTVVHSGDTTIVTVEDHNAEPENASCKTYCERLSACWYAVPNANPMLSAKEVFDRCWQEQHHCRTPTTELLCCGSIGVCGEFVKCQSAGRDVIAECSRQPHVSY